MRHRGRLPLRLRALLTLLPLAALLPRAASPVHAQGTEFDSKEIVQDNVWVVRSSLSKDGHLVNTSNIYVVRGSADSIWIFGTGYGDRTNRFDGPSDIKTYRPTKEAAHDAIYDASIVDDIIANQIGMERNDVTLTFLVPHFHFDHINKEFVAAMLETFGYSAAGTRILVHANDSLGAVCNTPCCGTTPCEGDNPYFCSPFKDPWTPQYLQLFEAVGAAGDSCNQLDYAFTSPTGTWELRKGRPVADGGHTDGTVNLDCPNLGIRMAGTVAGIQCPLAPGWRTLWIHGANEVVTGVGPGAGVLGTRGATEECVSLEGVGPNPFARSVAIGYRLPRQALVLVTIHDTVGRRIRTLENIVRSAGSWSVEWDGRDDGGREVAPGTYFYRLAADGDHVTGKAILLR